VFVFFRNPGHCLNKMCEKFVSHSVLCKNVFSDRKVFSDRAGMNFLNAKS
jgi:hypothetical protein